MQATLLDNMGTDLSVVNAARVSFAKESDWVENCQCGEPGNKDCNLTCDFVLRDADKRLIQFLARGMTEKDFDALVEGIRTAGITNVELDTHYTREETREYIENKLWEFRNQPQHSSPFRHCFASFHIKAPVFVARQLVKHQVGMSWNEISRRYVDDEPEFWWPDKWRGRSENKKQGSAGTVDLHEYECTGEVLPKSVWVMPLDESLSELSDMYKDQYKALIKAGVSPEMARMILPQNMYTEWHWSGSMLAWAHVCNLRCHPEAQQETRELCKYIDVSCENLWPVSWKALREGV